MIARRERVGLAFAALAAATAIGCEGTIVASAGPAAEPPPPSPAATVSFPCDGVVEPGPTAMRLLSTEQYLNTVRDLLGPVPQLDAVLATGHGPSAFGLVQADV